MAAPRNARRALVAPRQLRVGLRLLAAIRSCGDRPADVPAPSQAQRAGAGGWGTSRASCLPLLRHLRHLPDQLWVDLGVAVEGEEAVLLLLDVRELGIAEALDGPWVHQ